MPGCEDCVEGSLRREEGHDAEIPSVPAGANASSLHSHEGFPSTNANSSICQAIKLAVCFS